MIPAVLALTMIARKAAPAYTAAPLGFIAFDGRDNFLRGQVLSDNGLVAGSFVTDGGQYPFLWRNGVATPIDLRGYSILVKGVSNDGTVIGVTTDVPELGFRWTKANGVKAFSVDPNFVPQFGSGNFWVGDEWSTDRSSSTMALMRGDHPPSALMRDGVVFSKVGKVFKINSGGDLLGAKFDGQYSGGNPCLFAADGTDVMLSTETTLDGKTLDMGGDIADFNSDGTVCGDVHSRFGTFGAIWTRDGTRTDLKPETRLELINDNDVAVGLSQSYTPGVSEREVRNGGSVQPHLFVWDNVNGIRMLDDLVNLPGIRLVDAIAINKKGQILCTGVPFPQPENADITPQSYLLTPSP